MQQLHTTLRGNGFTNALWYFITATKHWWPEPKNLSLSLCRMMLSTQTRKKNWISGLLGNTVEWICIRFGTLLVCSGTDRQEGHYIYMVSSFAVWANRTPGVDALVSHKTQSHTHTCKRTCTYMPVYWMQANTLNLIYQRTQQQPNNIKLISWKASWKHNRVLLIWLKDRIMHQDCQRSKVSSSRSENQPQPRNLSSRSLPSRQETGRKKAQIFVFLQQDKAMPREREKRGGRQTQTETVWWMIHSGFWTVPHILAQTGQSFLRWA